MRDGFCFPRSDQDVSKPSMRPSISNAVLVGLDQMALTTAQIVPEICLESVRNPLQFLHFSLLPLPRDSGRAHHSPNRTSLSGPYP